MSIRGLPRPGKCHVHSLPAKRHLDFGGDCSKVPSVSRDGDRWVSFSYAENSQLLAGKDITGHHRQKKKADKKEKLISKYTVTKEVKLISKQASKQANKQTSQLDSETFSSPL